MFLTIPGEIVKKKIKYYPKNEEERNKISDNGYKKINTLFSAERFWKQIIDYVALDKKLYYDHG